MSDLYSRLLAAVQARKALAEAATPGPWWTRYGGEQGYIYASQAQRLVAVVDGEHADNAPAPNSRHIAANDPAFVIRACERDLKVLQRHRPTSPVLLDMAFIPAEIAKHLAEVMEPMCAGHGHHVIVDPGATWPCREIRDMAPVYGIEVSE